MLHNIQSKKQDILKGWRKYDIAQVLQNKQQREESNRLYADTYYSYTLCLFLGRSIRLPETYKYFNISDSFLSFLSCSHFRLSTLFKLWKEFIHTLFPIDLSFTTSFIIFWNFSMFYQTFLSPQVKPYATFTYNHGMYELPHQLLNNLRLRILGNYKISGNHPNFIEW